MPIEHIEKTDTLNEGREKLNNAITAFNETVVEGDSSVEAAQARVDEKGVPHPTLKARIDDGMNSVNQQLAQTETQIINLDNKKADESAVSNSLNVLKNQKVDQVTFDIVTHEIKFYGNGSLIDSIDITEASNAGLVQDYIDTLVSDGHIEGVTLADESVTTDKYADKSITSDKFADNYRVKFPYFSDDTFDLDYYWEDKTVIAAGDVKNNPFGTGCQVINFRAKTTEGASLVRVTQFAIVYGSGAEHSFGDAVYRHLRVNESTMEVQEKSDWKLVGIDIITHDLLDEDYAFQNYYSDGTYDLNNARKEGNYLVNGGVINNPLQEGCAMTVTRHRLDLETSSLWLVQDCVYYGSRNRGKRVWRMVNYGLDGQFNYASEWRGDISETVKILTIGNSFGLDTTKYIHRIAQSADINIVTGSLYISGGYFDDHYENITNDSNAYRLYRRNHVNGTITDDYIEDYSVDEALDLEDWDYVFFNQASAESGDYSSFQPFLNDIISYVKGKQPNIKIALMPTWAYSSDFDDDRFDKYNRNQEEMYNAIQEAYLEAMENVLFDDVIPVGTAIQNARSNEFMLGIDRELTRDGYHLGDTGCYIAGLTLFRTLIDNVVEIAYRPEAVRRKQAYLSEVAVNNAILNPFKVSEIA